MVTDAEPVLSIYWNVASRISLIVPDALPTLSAGVASLDIIFLPTLPPTIAVYLAPS